LESLKIQNVSIDLLNYTFKMTLVFIQRYNVMYNVMFLLNLGWDF
jgi:hypothetical protein